MRNIGVVTVGRSDYGLYRPLLRKIHSDPELQLSLIVAGTHLIPQYGHTIEEIEADGFPIAQRVDMLLASDTPAAIVKSIGIGIIGFSDAYARIQPDILVVLGDRYEMYAATTAAFPFNIPIAHIHGGELTLGAFDDAFRHSITKFSHLHFVAAREFGARVRQLGEEPWRITVAGALGIDAIQCTRLLTFDELVARVGVPLNRPFLLVTYHPETLEYKSAEWQISELLDALEIASVDVLFTMPNADSGSGIIRKKIQDFVKGRRSAVAVENLGTQTYITAMSFAAAMVGNSSSGIIEAMSFRLPVVNIGNRQAGRPRSANVIDVGHTRNEIVDGIRMAVCAPFRDGLLSAENLFGDGRAAEQILLGLKTIDLNRALLHKKFQDVEICKTL